MGKRKEIERIEEPLSKSEERESMKDIIVGRVTDVIDLETINLEVTQIVQNEGRHYNFEEKIRFHVLEYGHPKYRNRSMKG
jgi:hypothetical protein